MSDLTPAQIDAIRIAHNLADMGAPIFSAFRNSSKPLSDRMPFLLPTEWQHTKPSTSHNWIERWRPGMALCLVTGVAMDVLDVDPRNGGQEGMRELMEAGAWPMTFGKAVTPSAGRHFLIMRSGLAKGKPAKGVDLQAGARDGEGRGFIFLAPTVRLSRWGTREGQEVPYEWAEEPDPALVTHQRNGLVDDGLEALVERCSVRPARERITVTPAATPEDAEAFDSVAGWTVPQAQEFIERTLHKVVEARAGDINNTLGGAARALGRFVAGGYLSEEEAARLLTEALEAGGVHSDRWNVANGLGWTAATCIGAGLANGASEPWTVETPVAPAAPQADSTVAGLTDGRDLGHGSPSTVPPLNIESSAVMAYWLQSVLGSGTLSGFFLKGGQVVHTPRVDELGYVAPREGKDDDNGPAQIQAVSPGTLAAKIQYAHRCYKVIKDKETKETSEVPALFPLEAAKRAVDAPEAMGMLRALKGITHTPMVRADGSILAEPGYDAGTGYLFLPGPGVKVRPVPEVPNTHDVAAAGELIGRMTEGFPWESDDDRANYYGLLLTPLLRQLCPPTYKMFGIGAHQPGSGKTLLADVATLLHGGVLRSEMPEDEPEMRKQTTSILATTSAPIVHIDNVTGVLRSSTLAGLLTAGQPTQDRLLGTSQMVETVNDRVWVVTGNNLSLGGDLVRRTIIITIDPNMANPEQRSFAIPDLKAWVKGHRNELLWSLLVLIRHWVATGSALEARAQSDSFATWEATVGGILAAAGIPGAFDAQSGKRAAAGGDDDGLAQVLEMIWERQKGGDWTAAMVLEPRSGEFVLESMDWLPSAVLDKMSRSVAAGKKTFGYWLRNRLGRWVSGSDGHSYVIRQRPTKRDGSALWYLERTP